MKRTAYFIFLFFTVCSSAPAEQYRAPLYWESSITRALISRDEFYKDAGIPLNPLKFNFLNDPKSLQFLESRLAYSDRSAVPWGHFLHALSLTAIDSSAAGNKFNKALLIASESPGMAWVLFIESRRAGRYDWAEQCLKQVETLFLSDGAESAPVISQPLLAIARQENKAGRKENAIVFCEWSSRFDHSGAWQHLAMAYFLGPFKLKPFFSEAGAFISAVADSWRIQVIVFIFFFRFLKTSALIFVVPVFIVLSIKALPPFFKSIRRIYPPGVPGITRDIISGIVFAALALPGFVPFIALAGVLYWRHQNEKDRFFMIMAGSIAIAAVIFSSAEGTLAKVVDKDSPFSMFCQVSDEGYSQETETMLRTRLSANQDDYITRTALANLLRKSFDVKLAMAHMNSARRINETDPAVLVTSGNIHYTAGNTDMAMKYYHSAIDNHPGFVDAYFNYMACAKRTGAAVTDDIAVRASSLTNRRTTEFTQRNQYCFGENPPMIRQVIQPAYRPAYFWFRLFPEYVSIFRGLSSLHVFLIRRLPSMLAAAGALAFIFTALILARKFILKENEALRTDTAPMRIVMRDAQYQRKQKKYLLLIPSVSDCLFPGSKALMNDNGSQFESALMMLVSSFVYAIYWLCLSASFSIQSWLILPWILIAVSCCLLYNFISAARTARYLKNELAE